MATPLENILIDLNGTVNTTTCHTNTTWYVGLDGDGVQGWGLHNHIVVSETGTITVSVDY